MLMDDVYVSTRTAFRNEIDSSRRLCPVGYDDYFWNDLFARRQDVDVEIKEVLCRRKR